MGGIKAFLSVSLKCFGVEHVWKTLNSNQQPSGDRDNHRVGEGDASHGSHRMDNSQVPVHTYARQEPDAAIQIKIEAEPCYLAECLSENPSTPHEVVDHQKWKREQVENV